MKASALSFILSTICWSIFCSSVEAQQGGTITYNGDKGPKVRVNINPTPSGPLPSQPQRPREENSSKPYEGPRVESPWRGNGNPVSLPAPKLAQELRGPVRTAAVHRASTFAPTIQSHSFAPQKSFKGATIGKFLVAKDSVSLGVQKLKITVSQKDCFPSSSEEFQNYGRSAFQGTDKVEGTLTPEFGGAARDQHVNLVLLDRLLSGEGLALSNNKFYRTSIQRLVKNIRTEPQVNSIKYTTKTEQGLTSNSLLSQSLKRGMITATRFNPAFLINLSASAVQGAGEGLLQGVEATAGIVTDFVYGAGVVASAAAGNEKSQAELKNIKKAFVESTSRIARFASALAASGGDESPAPGPVDKEALKRQLAAWNALSESAKEISRNYWNDFANKTPEQQARAIGSMTGRVVYEIGLAVAGTKLADAVSMEAGAIDAVAELGRGTKITESLNSLENPAKSRMNFTDEVADLMNRGTLGEWDSLEFGKFSKSRKYKDVKILDANDINRTVHGEGRPPYLPDTKVEEAVTVKSDVYVRAYTKGITRTTGRWVIKKEAIENLSAQAIQQKYNLPYKPTHIVGVSIEEGAVVRRGLVNNLDFPNKGAIQYEVVNFNDKMSVIPNTERALR